MYKSEKSRFWGIRPRERLATQGSSSHMTARETEAHGEEERCPGEIEPGGVGVGVW